MELCAVAPLRNSLKDAGEDFAEDSRLRPPGQEAERCEEPYLIPIVLKHKTRLAQESHRGWAGSIMGTEYIEVTESEFGAFFLSLN